MTGPIRLLITARDVAAALHLAQIAKAAAADLRFEIVVVAQDPAAMQFERAGVPVRTVHWPTVKSAHDPQSTVLRESARTLLNEIAPAVVLSGLSTPFDASLDEAVLAEARVPTALYQDFWGEQNLVLGRGADHILAIDQQAAERNQARYGRASVVVGSSRHAAYAALDIDACRRNARRAIGAGDDERIVGFFGQALHRLPGYQRTIERFIEAMRRHGKGARLLLRPHPREDSAQRQHTAAMFASAGLDVMHGPDGPVEDAIAATDVVVSLFSICTFDAAYLNRFSASPLAVPMSLLFDEEIAAYCRQHGNYFNFAHHTQGLVRPVYDAAALPAELSAALDDTTKREVWENAHRYLPDPADSPGRVLDFLHAVARG